VFYATGTRVRQNHLKSIVLHWLSTGDQIPRCRDVRSGDPGQSDLKVSGGDICWFGKPEMEVPKCQICSSQQIKSGGFCESDQRFGRARCGGFGRPGLEVSGCGACLLWEARFFSGCQIWRFRETRSECS